MAKKVDYRNIEKDTETNNLYRKVIHTVPNKFQLVLMSLNVGEDIPAEVHEKQVQFIRIESGEGLAIVGPSKKRYKLKEGISITIPPKTRHYIKNTSEKDKLKLYTIYAPPDHPPNERNKRQPKE